MDLEEETAKDASTVLASARKLCSEKQVRVAQYAFLYCRGALSQACPSSSFREQVHHLRIEDLPSLRPKQGLEEGPGLPP